MIQDGINNPMVAITRDVLATIDKKLLLDSDFDRWNSTLNNTDKLLSELGVDDSVYSGAYVKEVITRNPELLWSLTRIKDNRESLSFFFKIFGVEDFGDLIKELPVDFHGDYDSVQTQLKSLEYNNCVGKIILKMGSSNLTVGDIALRVQVLNLYSVMTLDVCKRYSIAVEAEGEHTMHFMGRGLVESKVTVETEPFTLDRLIQAKVRKSLLKGESGASAIGVNAVAPILSLSDN